MELVLVTKKKRKKVIELAISRIVEQILGLMKEHIGESDGIEREELFAKVYGIKSDDLNELQEIALWHLLKRAMLVCRQKTHCFITNVRDGQDIYYFVVRTKHDAQAYSNIVTKSIKQMRAMERRAYRAAGEGWWREKWEYR